MRKLTSLVSLVLILSSTFLQAQITKTNQLPVVNLEITPVSKRSMVAPVWVKFYPANTYDPDGTIVLFKMDMNGDGDFEVNEKALKGSSKYFKKPGVYKVLIEVTDDEGGITKMTQEFIIHEYEQPVAEIPEAIEDTAIEEDVTDIPEVEWEETDIPWIMIWNPEGGNVLAQEIDSSQVSITDFKSISPIVSIEPEDEASSIGAARIKLPENIQLSDQEKEKVVMAFYEEAFSVSTLETDARWRYHTLDYDEKTDSYFAEMNHGCIVTFGVPVLIAGITYLVWDDATRLLLSKKSSSNFVLHYSTREISESRANKTLEILEKARNFLKKSPSAGGFGLNYPAVPAKIDVYYVDIGSTKKGDDIYGLYRRGKTGAKWIDLNNPSNFKSYDLNELEAIIVHELFHIVQYTNYNNSNYSWLNEALSTASERVFVKEKSFIASGQSPITNNNMYRSGLKNLISSEDGYSAGLFINFLENRYGPEIYSTILKECSRQITGATTQDPHKALSRAITRLARKKYPSSAEWQDLDRIWQDFTDVFIEDEQKPLLIDKRVDYGSIYNDIELKELTIGKEEMVTQWDIKVANLSFDSRKGQWFSVKPKEWNDEDKAIIDCKINYTPETNPAFDISTRIDYFNKRGKKGFIPNGARFLGRLNNASSEKSFSFHLDKVNRNHFLSFIPTGLGASSQQGFTKASFQLSCKIREEEKLEIAPDVPVSASAIDNYWWVYWKTAVQIRATGKKIEILNESPLDAMYSKAKSEWKPIEEQLKFIKEEIYKFDELLSPLTRWHYHYYEEHRKAQWKTQGKAKSLSPEKSSKIDEIAENYYNLHNLCSEATAAFETFSNVSLIGMKSEVLVYPNRLRYVHLQDKKLPEKSEIEKLLKKFHDRLSKIEPAEKALKDFEEYWGENEKEAQEIINEIKTLYPVDE